jgi:hypothetical protein
MIDRGRAMLWLALAACLYLAACAGLFLMQDRLLYFPHRGAVAPEDWGLPEMRLVPLATADGLTVSSWYAPARDAGKPTLVMMHGNAGHPGFRAPKLRPLLEEGYGVLVVGYRGYAGNPGEPREAGLLADARAALDHLVGQGVSGSRVVLYGESLGCPLAVRLATERRVGALILEAPSTSIADVAAEKVPFFPVRLLLRDRYESLSRIPDIRTPLLVIHGERDTLVPARHGKALFAAAAEPKRGFWPEAAGHNDLHLHGSTEAIMDFLEDLARGFRPRATLEQETAKGTALVRR